MKQIKIGEYQLGRDESFKDFAESIQRRGFRVLDIPGIDGALIYDREGKEVGSYDMLAHRLFAYIGSDPEVLTELENFTEEYIVSRASAVDSSTSDQPK